MSSQNFKKACAYCSGNHTKVSKCAQYYRDKSLAKYITCIDLTCKETQTMLPGIPKNILRLAVNLIENGKPCKAVKDVSVWLVPRTQRNKPLCKFTKCQLIRRLVQISTDFAQQVDTIIARKERQKAERQEAEQNVCPICLDPLGNQAQCTSPCGHTFCSSCFVTHLSTELSRGNTAKCPCCRRTTAEITNRW
jgi:hypothetical protein